MSKKRLIAYYTSFIITALLFCLTGCFGPGMNDWVFELPNGYEINRINSQRVVCGKRNEGGALSYPNDLFHYSILAFYCDSDVIFLRCHKNIPGKVITETEEEKYYIIYTQTDIILGPLAEKEYLETDIKKPRTNDWIFTRSAPSGAIYPDGSVKR